MNTYNGNNGRQGLFAKALSPRQLAEKELRDIRYKQMHYDNELLLVQNQVDYLEVRSKQLMAQLSSGMLGSNLDMPKPYAAQKDSPKVQVAPPPVAP